MREELKHKIKLIKDISDSISYWSDKNEEYMEAYMYMLNMFTNPQQDEESQIINN